MSDLPLNQILCGDCVEVLKDFPDNSIDLVVTDPPYGLSFMGKDWDKALPSREAFTEIIRVLKPGALAFVMSSPRQDLLWRMLALLEGVGFELTQSYIDWIYKTGFPKAYDVSKGIDKRPNRLQKNPFKEYCNKQRKKLDLSLNNVNELGGWATTGGGIASDIMGNKKFNEIPSIATYNKLKSILQLDNRYDNLIEEAEREKIGEAKTRSISWFGGDKWDITNPALDDAKKWAGWKSQTGLKPAHEPILMVNKPFSEKTIVDNVLKWGTGAINVDVCRIPYQNQDDKEEYIKKRHSFDGITGIPKVAKIDENYMGGLTELDPQTQIDSACKGRFPANLLVSERALDTGKLSKSRTLESHHKINSSKTRNIYGEYQDQPPEEHTTYGDVGDQSRYFNLDAWAEHNGFLDVPKPDNKERYYGLKGRKAVPKSKFNLNDGSKDERFDGAVSLPRRNIHPTVKPVKLMAYLIELGCPPDGVVLDPFVGSGTTCIAAKKLVRKYVGIEINPEYVALAEARIRAYPVPFDWFTEEDVGVPPKEVTK